jgi:CheY-like chemotaxis protein
MVGDMPQKRRATATVAIRFWTGSFCPDPDNWRQQRSRGPLARDWPLNLPVRGRWAAVWTIMTTATPAILVVEDEPLLRLMAVDIVEDAGFEALSAATADEALAILETRADVRLVFTDVQMPGSMDGLRLAHAVRDRWPPVELIVTSGRGHIPANDLPESRALFCQAL